MQDFGPTGSDPIETKAGAVESGSPESPNISDPAPPVGGDAPASVAVDDVVHTSRPPGANRPGHQSKWLRKGTERALVRGFKTKEEIIRLHCIEGKPLKVVAKELGRHHRYVQQVYQVIVADVKGRATKGEKDDDVRTFADKHLRNVIIQAAAMVNDNAAYGAVVIRGVSELCALHGVKPEEAGITGGIASLEDIGQAVRVASPLLMDKLARVQSIKAAAGTVRDAPSVPVEVDPEGE
jgi:hypothetical protein